MSEASWLPEPTPETVPYFEGAKAGRLRLQCCTACEGWTFPYKERCQRCGATTLEWRDASGRGTLYSHARLHRSYHPRHEGRLPIVLAQVDTEEGVRLWTNLIGADGDFPPRAGMAVEVAFENLTGGGVIPVFRPAQ